MSALWSNKNNRVLRGYKRVLQGTLPTLTSNLVKYAIFLDAEQIGAKRRKKVPHFSEIEQTVTSTAQGSDPGAGPSRSEASTNPAAFLNPLIFSPYLAGGTPFPGLGFPPLFSGGFNPSGSFASGTSFGGVGGGAASVPFPTGDEEPSTSNLS